MLSARSALFAVLAAFWIMGFISEIDSSRAMTTYLVISLLLLSLMAALRQKPAA